MISRLVKEKNFGFGEDALGDSDSHSPSSGEGVGRPLHVLLRETDTGQNLDSLRLSLVGTDRVQALENLGGASIVPRDLFLGELRVVNSGESIHFLQKLDTLDITVQDVLEHTYFVALDLLLNLQRMHVFGVLLDLATTDGVDETCLTDTVATNETVLAALSQLEGGSFQQSFTAHDNRDTLDVDVLVEAVALLVAHHGRRDSLLVAHKFGNFLVERVLLLLLAFLGSLAEFSRFVLRVRVGFGAFHSGERIEEIFVTDGTHATIGLLLGHHDWVAQLLSDDRVSLLDKEELFLQENSRENFADLKGIIFVVRHSVGHEVGDEPVELPGVPWAVLFD